MTKLIRRCVVIPEKLWEDILKEANKINISASAYIRMILSEQIDNRR